MILHGTYSISQNLHGLRLAPLKVKALADSKLAVWQREDSAVVPLWRLDLRLDAIVKNHRRCEDLGSILAFDNFDGAVEQDSKATSWPDATRDAMGCMAMKYHEIPWNTMKYHEIQWNVMKSWANMSLGAPKKSWIQQVANSWHRITALTSVQHNSTQ